MEKMQGVKGMSILDRLKINWFKKAGTGLGMQNLRC